MGSIGGMIIPCGAEGIANPHCTNTMNALESQVDLLLPELQKAMDTATEAADKVKELKQQIKVLIETPQTINCNWGVVILKKPARTIKVISKLLTNKINLLKEEGVLTGDSQVNIGESALSVIFSDKTK